MSAKVVSHRRYVTFQMAEVAVPRRMFAEILSLIARLGHGPRRYEGPVKRKFAEERTAKVRFDAGQSACVDASAPETAGFDGLLLAGTRFVFAQAAQKARSCV